MQREISFPQQKDYQQTPLTRLLISFKGTKNCTLAFVNTGLIPNKASTVLNIVTTYAWTGSAYVVPSATAKAGVLAMTEVLL
jgi:hypothetical protein